MIYFQKVAKIQRPKLTIQEPRFHHKLTTNDHQKTTFFRQKIATPPAKTPLHHKKKKLTNCGHRSAEETFEVVGGFGILLDGGLDGLLRNRPRVTEIDQSGQRVIAGSTVM